MLQLASDIDEREFVPEQAQFLKWLAAIEQFVSSTPPLDADSLTIRVVSPEESRALNLQFRGKNSSTNVLSFPSQLADIPQIAEMIDTRYLGDLAICAAVVAREAIEQNKAETAHWAHMLIHGVLHLYGYDHIENDEAEEMEALETQILMQLGFPAPYAE